MVLCSILESNFRRAMILAKGNLISYFFTRPVAMVIVLIIILFAMIPVFMSVAERAKKAREA